MILQAAEGRDNLQIAEQLAVGRDTVARWRQRFAVSGIAGILKDAPRRGRKPKLSEQKVQEIVHKTTHKALLIFLFFDGRAVAQGIAHFFAF